MNFENFGAKSPETKKEEMFPEDYPMYPKDYHYEESTRVGMTDDNKQMFFDNKGELDKDLTTRMWYAVTNAARMNTYNIPKEDPLNIAISGFLKLDGIDFEECFSKSGAYWGMACLPENDPERQKLLDFQVDLVMNSFLSNVKKIADSIPELKEAARNLVRAKINYDADKLRRRILNNSDNSENREADELSENLQEEYQSARKEFNEIMEKNNIQY